MICSRSVFDSSVRRTLLRCCSTLSYVQRVRLIEKWKTNEEAFRETLPSSSVLAFVRKEPIVKRISHSEPHIKFVPYWTQIKELQDDVMDSVVLLGASDEGSPLCGVSVEENSPFVEKLLSGGKKVCRTISMYAAMLSLSWDDAQITSKTNSLLRWNRIFQYCPKCRDPLRRHATGTSRSCDSCSRTYYPSMYPVGIVLIYNPQRTHVLLIGLPRMPGGFYTCVAGFSDPGESVEETVRREAAEEIGLEVRDLQPIRSQHWPFPDSSLMFGFTAVADLQEPTINTDEVTAARWFTREELSESLRKIQADPGIRLRAIKDPDFIPPDALLVPPDGTMSHKLIVHWLSNY